MKPDRPDGPQRGDVEILRAQATESPQWLTYDKSLALAPRSGLGADATMKVERGGAPFAELS
jgi:hypothetical protein